MNPELIERVARAARSTAEDLERRQAWNYDGTEVTSLGVTAQAFRDFAEWVETLA